MNVTMSISKVYEKTTQEAKEKHKKEQKKENKLLKSLFNKLLKNNFNNVDPILTSEYETYFMEYDELQSEELVYVIDDIIIYITYGFGFDCKVYIYKNYESFEKYTYTCSEDYGYELTLNKNTAFECNITNFNMYQLFKLKQLYDKYY